MPGARHPLIGLPAIAIPAGPKPARFGLNQSYVRALEAAGAIPVLIPPLEDAARLRALVARLDGVLFPGGGDVAPQEYGEVAVAALNAVEPARDRRELTLAGWALERDLPILGVCRGQQLINVAMGGTLYQDLRIQQVTHVDHHGGERRQRTALVHLVRLEPDSRLAQLIGETGVQVNSLHHQAVRDVAPGLRVAGRAPDGVIEAVESRDRRFLVAVQWHPEELAGVPWVARLFKGFVQAASRDRA